MCGFIVFLTNMRIFFLLLDFLEFKHLKIYYICSEACLMFIQKIRNLPPEYRITGLYLLVGLAWILFSDMILGWFVDDVQTMRKLQTFKGWFYVSVTALLFFFLIQRAFKKINEVKNTLHQAVEHYSYLFSNNPHPMWVFDCEKQKPVEVNVAALKI